MTISDKQIINIIKNEVVMALGCTEPIAVALSVCRSREILGAIPEKIELSVSGNIFKNVKDVGIPGSDKTGIMIAAGLGALTGHSRDNLELLKDINPEISAKAIQMVADKKISIDIEKDVDNLYIKAISYYKEHSTTVIIEKRHNNIVFVEDNGNVIFVAKDEDCKKDKEVETENTEKLSIKRILEFANEMPLEELEFIREGINPNIAISEEGLINNYGLKIGKTLSQSCNFTYSPIVTQVAGALDARMSGSLMPVMTNSGSGNQGLTIFVSIVKYARDNGYTEDELTRALIVGNLIPIHIKKRIGPLSALCGLIPASIGAGCGIMYLKNKSIEKISSLIKYVIADVSGLFCDGAKPSCALKLISCLNSAIHGIDLIENGIEIPFNHGIIDDNVEITISNLTTIASNGMDRTDAEILDIIKNACK
jgi:L-cysteine desulfidase